MESILRTFVDTANRLIWQSPEELPWMVCLLLFTGVFMTFRMGWPNVRYFMHAFDVVRGKFDKGDDVGDINHFQALSTALSATVGVGNIAGVALAIHYGGPGTIVWLWISGIFGMTLKFAEATLAVQYRSIDQKGFVSGGPMYYIERGLGPHWKWLGATFAGLTIVSTFGIGCMNQSNTVAVSARSAFGCPEWVAGLVLAVLVGLVILGGIKRIGAVSSRLMPAMALLYIGGALFILLTRIDTLPSLFKTIIAEAIHPKAAFGGTAAGVWHLTMLWGIKRALFSNEAGMGSAPIAHAAAKTEEPVREGVVAMLGPFIDTLMICTLTGLVIISTGTWDRKKPDLLPLDPSKISIYQNRDFNLQTTDVSETASARLTDGEFRVREGQCASVRFAVNDGFIDSVRLVSDGQPWSGRVYVKDQSIRDSLNRPLSLRIHGNMLQNSSALTSWAFATGFGRYHLLGAWIVTLSVFLFALSTIISWSYYGDRCVEYLFGVRFVPVYRLIYVIVLYFGAVLALETVWAYGDMALGLMTVPNLIAVLMLSPKLKTLARDYFSRMFSSQ